MNNRVLLEVNNLKKYFPVRNRFFSNVRGYIKAVDGVSFKIREGETLGLVGESGCGKTSLGMCIFRLTEITGGEILFKNREITHLVTKDIPKLYQEMQMVFQDPYGSLNPRMKVGETVAEPLVIHHFTRNRNEMMKKVCQLLEDVGLDDSFLNKYPFELSGGQRQRIVIARALAVSPSLIICDEPSSALDVSIQAQILNLLGDLKKKSALTYLFISHDLSIVKHISEQIAVMYLGKIIEIGESEKVISHAKHPYTRALIASVPVPDPKIKNCVLPLREEVPSPIHLPRGCRFHTCCPEVKEICSRVEPELRERGKDHFVACHFF